MLKFKKKLIVEFIETKQLNVDSGIDTYYCTHLNNNFVHNSLSYDKEKALLFYNNFIKHNCKNKIENKLITKII